jgi:streptogramin lyase
VGSGLRWLIAVSLGMVLLASATGAAAPTITEYRAGITVGSGPDGIVAGPDGNLWFSEFVGDRVARITPAGVVTEYRLAADSRPGDIDAGPDGNLWFIESRDRVAKITPAGVVTEYSAGITPHSAPERIAAGPDGNLWFTELDGNTVARITPAGVVTEYNAGITPGSAPEGIAAGPDGNLWFTELGDDRVARITPAGVVTEYGGSVIVTTTVKGKGRVTGGGISCPGRCEVTIASGTRLTLRASAARGYRFAGWSGKCRGLHACTLHPKAAVKITATFRRRHFAT